MAPRRPLISILVCTYNRAHLIRDTLDSILAQEYAPVEIFVIDDGSTDDTQLVMKDYANQVHYHRCASNRGIAAARNTGCRLANGEYIAFQDDDDLMPADRLTALRRALERYPEAALAVGDLAIIDSQGRETGGRWLPVDPSAGPTPTSRLVEDGYAAVLWPRLPVSPVTTLFRKRDGERVGWFDESFQYASEDKDFFARLAGDRAIAYVPRVVCHLRRGHTSLTHNTIRTDYQSMSLFRKHMIAMKDAGNVDEALYRRLQQRIRLALERIDRVHANGADLPPYIPGDFQRSWLSLLEPTDRLRFLWRTAVIGRVRRLARWLGIR